MKHFLLVSLAVVMALSLAACGTVIAPTESQTSTAAKAPAAPAATAAAPIPADQPPSDDPLIAGFQRSTVASVADAVDQVIGERGFLSHEFRPYVTGKFVGRARTALVKPAPKDKATPSLAVKHSVEMIDSSNPGEVGVIVMENGLDVAAIGGLMGTAAKARGMVGMVLDGGVRDLAELRALGLPVYARSVTPSTAVGRFASVARDIPVKAGGVMIKPGDIIVAGEDGVVRVPQEKAAEVLKAAQAIDEREIKMVPDIQRNKSLSKTIEQFNRI